MSKERFDRTVAILVKAYLDGTLEHNNCAACAVGNIVAANNMYEFADLEEIDPCVIGTIKWKGMPLRQTWHWMMALNKLRDTETIVPTCFDELLAFDQVKSTGYTLLEVDRIERAFESAIWHNDHDGFNGLMAVVSVLASIDNISLEHTEEARKMFVKC